MVFSRTLGVAVLLTAVLVMTACGADEQGRSQDAPAQAASNGSAAGELPEAIRSKGTLKVAADATYPPNEFLAPDGKTVTGMSADLAAALGKVMGIRVEMVNAPFDSILPGLAAGKYDLGISSFTDTREREKAVDFATYYSAGTSFFVRAEGGPAIGALRDLCGHTIAVQKGTVQAEDAAARAQACRNEAREPLRVLVLPDQPAANLALASGRADVAMTDSPAAAYQVRKSGGRFKVSGEPFGSAPYGIAIPKGNGMAEPILQAVEALMRDGTYGAILRKWGVEVGAIDDPAINAAAE
jgi:polar amino acid transport system substrate-binding protein